MNETVNVNTSATATAAPWPPAGFVDRDGAARMFGIQPDTLAMWHTRGRIRCGTWAKSPNGKRCKVYPLAELERVRAEMAASRPRLPDGFVDVDGACRMFGVSKAAWVIWKRKGKVPRGRWGRSPTNKPCRIYAVEDLRRAMDRLRGPERVYREGGGSGQYHIPPGWVSMRDACQMFGVHPNTWNRWERDGLITCGKRFTARRLKLYPLDQLERLLAECGRYAPPYPDPHRPGCYRVPLAGEDIHRREALIDAADVPLIEGKRFHFSRSAADDPGRVATFDRSGDASRLHQIITGVRGTGWKIAHLNGDPLDCRRANLVVRNLSESGAAARKAATFCGRPCMSRFKGVCWSEHRGRWKAYVKKDGVMRNLGYFNDEIAAAQARDEAARELFGDHARLNFPDGVDAWLEAEPTRTERAEAA
jgi:hypothetical protein